jgi:MFS family permease
MPHAKPHQAWIVLGAVVAIMVATSGLRQVFGVFIRPMEAEFHWDRATVSGVAAVSWLLLGAVSPIAGTLADRWSARWVLVLSCAVLGVGAVLSSWVGSLWHLYVTAGILMAAGGGGASMPAAAVIAARWFEARRGLVLGLLGAGSSAGQLILFPLAVWLMLNHGWRWSFLAMGLIMLAITIPAGLAFVRDDPAERGATPYGAGAGSRLAGAAPAERRVGVDEALRVPAFWLLMSTFFVCGYTTGGLVITHLVPHTSEHGFSEMDAARALGVMGAMNIVGTISSGWLCDRFGPKRPLAVYYFVRGVSLLFLPYVSNMPGLYLFAAVFGLNFISTVPATTALTARIFGRLSVGALSGWILFAHQVGAAMGAALAGWLFDATHSYTWAFISGAALATLAAAMSLAIDERPVSRKPTAAPAAPGLAAPAG